MDVVKKVDDLRAYWKNWDSRGRFYHLRVESIAVTVEITEEFSC